MKNALKYIKLILLTIIVAIAFRFIAGEQLDYTLVEVEMPQKENVLPEPTAGTIVEQRVIANANAIRSITFQPFSYGRDNKGLIDFFLLDNAQNVVAATSIKAEDCVDYMPYTMTLGQDVPLNKGEEYTLRFVFNGLEGENPSFYYAVNNLEDYTITTDGGLTVNGNPIGGTLCIGVLGLEKEWFGTYYWYIVGGVLVFLLGYQAWADFQTKRGRFTVVTLMLAIWKHYRFLIEQLVSRDFKVKYKRSVLGYCWSFLNPLLTMLVQYIVFSSIFRYEIDNFPVYLLTGNIIFSYFTEAISQGLMAIVGNASLITKVYVPKYIYPVTKVLSTSINLFISLIPLLLVSIMTGERLNLTILLIPYALCCLLLFSMGLTLLLSAINVFFRDVQYLWNIVSLIWMYATPIFYPAEIIPENLRFIQTLNPLYHIILLVRSVLMEGMSPRPIVYFYCLGGALISLAIGAIVFKKTQGKFVLYI